MGVSASGEEISVDLARTVDPCKLSVVQANPVESEAHMGWIETLRKSDAGCAWDKMEEGARSKPSKPVPASVPAPRELEVSDS